VNIYIAHYHFEESLVRLAVGRSSVNTACSLEMNCDKPCDDSAGANCSRHQMVDPLTVNADVCWWRHSHSHSHAAVCHIQTKPHSLHLPLPTVTTFSIRQNCTLEGM